MTLHFDAWREQAHSAPPSPTAHALDDAWPGVRRRLFSPRHLRDAWWLWRRYRLRRLNRKELRVEAPMGKVPDCERCPTSCCEAPHLVSLGFYDVARLVDAGFGWAVVPFSLSARLPVYEAHPELRASERRDTVRRFPVLAQRDGRCVFFDDERRCAIYPLRPSSCRRFPYQLSTSGRLITYAPSCPASRPGGHAAQQQMSEAVIERFNRQIQDLVMLRIARPDLEQMGLTEYLPRGFSRHGLEL